MPSACVARACSWLGAADLGSLVSLSCWRLDADPAGLGALTVALGVRANATSKFGGRAWIPRIARPPLAPLEALVSAEGALGDGSRCLAALDALRRDCGRTARTASDALAAFERALRGRRGAPSGANGAAGKAVVAVGARPALAGLLALCGAVERSAGADAARRVAVSESIAWDIFELLCLAQIELVFHDSWTVDQSSLSSRQLKTNDWGNSSRKHSS